MQSTLRILGVYVSALSLSVLTAQPARAAEGLTYSNIAVYRIGPGGTFDLDTWVGKGGIAYTLSAEARVLISSRGEIY